MDATKQQITEPDVAKAEKLAPAVEVLTKAVYSDDLTEFLSSAKPKTHRAVIDIFWGWARIIAVIGLFALYPNPLTYLIAIGFISSGMGILVALSHESQHSALLRSKKWNALVGAWLCAYPVGSVYGTSRAVHLAHHKYLNTPLDPDRHFHAEEDKSTPKEFASYFVRLLCGGQLWTSFVVNGFLRNKQTSANPSEAVVVLPKHQVPEVTNLFPVQIVIFGLLWLVTGFWWAYFALWLVPVFTIGTFLGYLRGFIDHARLCGDDDKLSAGRLISVPHPSLLDRLFLTGLDFHFHAEHHLFPSVPHYYLPQLHTILQNDEQFRDSYLVRPTYFSFLREYWKEISVGARNTAR